MVDVAVAGALLAVVSFIAVQFVLGVSDSAETSLLRANSRRQVVLLRTSFQNDFGSATVCGTNRFGSTLQLAPDGGSFQLYTDVGGDGTADLVGYRVQGTSLQRKVVLGTGADCATLGADLSASSGWTTLVATVRPVGTRAVFTPLWRGAEVDAATACVDAACRADTVKVDLTVDAPRAGRVDLSQAYALPDSATRTPRGADQGSAPATVPAADTTGAPRALAAEPGEGAVTVTWDPPAGGAAVTGYTVHHGTSGDLRAAATTPAGTGQDLTVAGLANGTRYWFWVTAVSDAGQATAGPVSATPAWPAPDAPAAVSATATSGTTATVAWSAAAGGATATGYTVWWATGAEFAGARSARADGGAASAEVTGLDPATTYWFWVTATSPGGESAPAGPDQATTAVPAPTALAAAAVDGDDTAVDLTWTAAAGAPAGYKVYRQGAAEPVCTTEAPTTSCRATGLAGGTAYTFTATATKGTTESSASDPATATTAPPAPGSAAAATSGTSWSATWAAASTATSYEAQTAQDTGTATAVLAPSTTSVGTSTGTQSGTSGARYQTRVRAARTDGGTTVRSPWSAWSAWSAWTTPSVPAAGSASVCGALQGPAGYQRQYNYCTSFTPGYGAAYLEVYRTIANVGTETKVESSVAVPVPGSSQTYTDADAPADADLRAGLAAEARNGASTYGLLGFSAAYTVKACNSNGCSAKSSPVTAQSQWYSVTTLAAAGQTLRGVTMRQYSYTFGTTAALKGWWYNQDLADSNYGSWGAGNVGWSWGSNNLLTLAPCGTAPAPRTYGDNVEADYWWNQHFPSYGQYNFQVVSDDGSALYLDDRPNRTAGTANRWGANNSTWNSTAVYKFFDTVGTAGVVNHTTAAKWVAPGEQLPVMATYVENYGSATFTVMWQRAGGWDTSTMRPVSRDWTEYQKIGSAAGLTSGQSCT